MPKPSLKFLLGLAFVTQMGVAYAQGVHGGNLQEVGGPGFAVSDEKGGIKLVDTLNNFLAAPSCTGLTAFDEVYEYHADQVINALAKVHPYASVAYFEEAKRIHICFASKFNPRFTSALTKAVGPTIKLFVSTDHNSEVVAIRKDDWVIVDNSKFAAFDDDSKALLWTHEIGHSFVSDSANAAQSALSQFTRFDNFSFWNTDQSVTQEYERALILNNALYVNWKQGMSPEAFSKILDRVSSSIPRDDSFFEAAPETWKKALTNYSDFEKENGTLVDEKTRTQAISRISWETVEKIILDQDRLSIERFVNRQYSLAGQILRSQALGWEQALRNEIQARGLDPLQNVPAFGSLMEIAIDQSNSSAVQILSSFPSAAIDRGTHLKLLTAVIQNKITVDNVDQLIAEFNPNDGALVKAEDVKNRYGRFEEFYAGQVPLLVVALSADNWEIAKRLLDTGKVNANTAQLSIQAIAMIPMGTTQGGLVTQTDQNRRDIFDRLLQVPGVKIRGQEFADAMVGRNAYVAERLLALTSVSMTDLARVVRSSWNTPQAIQLFNQAVKNSGINVNSVNSEGKALMNYAMDAHSNEYIYALLALGAKFDRPQTNAEMQWYLKDLIQHDNKAALLSYLRSIHLHSSLSADLSNSLVYYKNIAKTLGKKNAEAAIDEAIQSNQ